MKNIFLISIVILIISINSQPKKPNNKNAKPINKHQNTLTPNKKSEPKQQNKTNPNPNINPSTKQNIPKLNITNNATTNPNINNNNTSVLNEQKNQTEKKDFNLTESLINFFNQMFGSSQNETNNTKTEAEKALDQKREEQKKKEEENKRKILEQINLEKEKIEIKKKEKKLQLEKDREEFEKKIENISISDFANLNLEPKSGELLYHNTTVPCKITIMFLLTDTERTIHLVFNGPNGKGGSSLIKSFRNKNFLYYEYDAKNIGQYTFYLNNYHNSEETEVVFAVADDSKKMEDKLEKEKIDKISLYLNEIDVKINTMSIKQNIVNRKTEKHNDSVNKHNKKILIYSGIEVVTMVFVFLLQTCYIKRIVEKV